MRTLVVCPVNKASLLAWAGGDMAQMNPGTRECELELYPVQFETEGLSLGCSLAAPIWRFSRKRFRQARLKQCAIATL